MQGSWDQGSRTVRLTSYLAMFVPVSSTYLRVTGSITGTVRGGAYALPEQLDYRGQRGVPGRPRVSRLILDMLILL